MRKSRWGTFAGLRAVWQKGPRLRGGVAASTVEQRKPRSSQELRRPSCSPRWRPRVAGGGGPRPRTGPSTTLPNERGTPSARLAVASLALASFEAAVLLLLVFDL